MLPERIIQQPQPPTQEAHVVTLVPEQAIPAMQQAIITVLQTLPTPITITPHEDAQQKAYYTYQVGEKTGSVSISKGWREGNKKEG